MQGGRRHRRGRRCRGFRRRRDADLDRIDPDRLGDVLEFGRTEIRRRQVEPPFHLPVGLLRKTNRAGLRHAFNSGGDVDRIAHQVAIVLLDDVADMHADAKLDAPVLRHAGVALDKALLHFDGAAHGVDHAAKLDDRAVAGALDDPAAMGGDGRVDQVAAQAAQARERALLVGAGEPAVADDIRDQDRCELAGLAHGAPLAVATIAKIPAAVCLCEVGRTAHVRGADHRSAERIVRSG